MLPQDTQDFYEKVKDTNVTAVPALNFTSELFHGASFDVSEGDSVEAIEALPEVKKVWPVSIVYAPQPDAEHRGEGPDILKWDPHVLTRVNDVHDRGIDGNDVIVAVVDSGIDYNHPALGGGFGPGFKVEAGWDFVGNEYDVENPSVFYPGPDPKDCMGHGTHVAGIIASGNKDLPGVAPNARLRAYKVFGCSDGVTEDIIGQAIIRAFEEGADIITASLGSDRGFPDNVVATLISKITAQGTFVSAAAGNSGIRGMRLLAQQPDRISLTRLGRTLPHKQPRQRLWLPDRRQRRAPAKGRLQGRSQVQRWRVARHCKLQRFAHRGIRS
jgi:subtilisin family serine protease